MSHVFEEHRLALRSAPPHTGSPGLFGTGTPGRVRKESGKSTPGQGPKSAERVHPGSLKKVRIESESQVLDSFETPGRALWALPRGTLFGLFSGAKGPGDPVWGRADPQVLLLGTSHL